MHLYKLLCRSTGKSYVGLCENEPNISTLDLPKNVMEDIALYGVKNFVIFRIAKHNDKVKATDKAETLIYKEQPQYNTEAEKVKVDDFEIDEDSGEVFTDFTSDVFEY